MERVWWCKFPSFISVLSHRISLKPSAKYLKSPEDFIKEEFDKFAEEHKNKRDDFL